MPLFHRRTPPDFAVPAGTLPCAETGCTNTNAVTCAYRDRHQVHCEAAFCPSHWAMVGGVVYCRRHASTITALGDHADTLGLPELGNRGASLVNWIADGLNGDVVALLNAVARATENVHGDDEVTVVFDTNRRRRWERSWKLFENTGISLKVSLQVSADTDDALVDARVGPTVVARGVPPWITRRRSGVEVTDQVDAEQRELFRRFLLDHIAAEVELLRAEDEAQRNSLSL